MKVAEMRIRLYDIIDMADEKKIKALYTLLENDTEEEAEWWNDEKLLVEFDRRYEAWESGKEKGYTFDEVKASM